jgi:galactokinase
MKQDLTTRVKETFARAFGGEPQLVAYAPGRVNLIGEHTDYNGGFVLPCAINYGTAIAVRARPGARVTVIASDFDDASDSFDLGAAPIAQGPLEWANYVRGIFSVFQSRGFAPLGCDIAVAGDVPRGAGLSSSASLGVALAQAIAALNGFNSLTASDFALIAQASENDFVGCACGIMDQLVSACAVRDHALLIDCRSLETRAVPVPEEWAVLIVHSGVKRGLVESAYNERRQQCEAAARHYGVAALRDLDAAGLVERRADLDDVAFRRARHVVSENARALAATDAMQRGDLAAMGRLMAASHASLRDDFQVTVPAVDALVDRLKHLIGEDGGVRMTGGGFGGCVVAVVPGSKAEGVLQSIGAASGTQSLLQIVARPESGAHLI